MRSIILFLLTIANLLSSEFLNEEKTPKVFVLHEFIQIKGLNIYRLYAYARPQECLDFYRRQDIDNGSLDGF